MLNTNKGVHVLKRVCVEVLMRTRDLRKKSHLGNEVDGGGDDSRESTGNCSRDFCRPFSMSMAIQQNNYFEEDEIKQPNTVGGRYSELLFVLGTEL